MSLTRRSIMQGIAWTSIAVPLAGRGVPVSAFAPSERMPVPTLGLVPAALRDGDFVHGLRAAAGPGLRIVEVDDSLGALREMVKAMESRRAVRVAGLLDDAIATPLLDMARSTGARMHWLGQHVSATDGSCRHLLTTADGELRAGRLSVASPFDGSGWDRELATLLVSGEADTRGSAAPHGWHPVPPMGSFVSFLIQA